MYVPKGEDISVGHNATWKPIILVYGDYADADAVTSAAANEGFAEIAAQEECCVMFINKSGDTWTENDKYSYIAAMLKYSDSTNYSYDAITGLQLNDDGTSNDYYPGYSERSYVFADGDAANFVSTYLTKGIKATINYSESYFKPAALYLSNVTAVTDEVLTTRDTSVDVPVYLVNASSNVEKAYKAFNSDSSKVAKATTSKKDGLSGSKIKTAWNNFIKNYRRCHDVSIEITDYSDIETEYEYQCDDGTVIEYYAYVPDDCYWYEDGTVPLVVGFHGNGNSALTMAHLDEWPELACEEGFIYISVNKHELKTDAEVMEMLEDYVENNALIDTSRIYCTGFSQGSRRTLALTLSEKYADFFAAAAPMNAMILAGYEDPVDESEDAIIMPTMYVGANCSHIQEVVNHFYVGYIATWPPVNGLKVLSTRNKWADPYTENDGTGYWGYTSDNTTVTTVPTTYYDDITTQVTDIESEDGNVYTRLVAAIGVGHEYQDTYAKLAWEFMSKFSRAEDGSVLIEEEEEVQPDGLADKAAEDGNWYYYQDNMINDEYTGLAQNVNGWWYVKNGAVDFTYYGIVKNQYGWWRVEGGKVNFNCNSIERNEYGWWKLKNGKVDFTYTGLANNKYGWWYVKNGKVDFTYYGIVKNQYGWWRVENGKVNFNCNTIEHNENGWWKLKNGKVDFSFTGIGYNANGAWYCQNGKVIFSKNGNVNYNGDVYTIKNGKVVKIK